MISNLCDRPASRCTPHPNRWIGFNSIASWLAQDNLNRLFQFTVRCWHFRIVSLARSCWPNVEVVLNKKGYDEKVNIYIDWHDKVQISCSIQTGKIFLQIKWVLNIIIILWCYERLWKLFFEILTIWCCNRMFHGCFGHFIFKAIKLLVSWNKEDRYRWERNSTSFRIKLLQDITSHKISSNMWLKNKIKPNQAKPNQMTKITTIVPTRFSRY